MNLTEKRSNSRLLVDGNMEGPVVCLCGLRF